MMKEHFSIEFCIGLVLVNLSGRHVKEVIVLFQTELCCRTNSVVKFPPNNVAVPILSAINILVATWSNSVACRWRICRIATANRVRVRSFSTDLDLSILTKLRTVNTTETGLACLEASSEGASIIILVANLAQIVRCAWNGD